MSEKLNVELGPVQTTLLLPLWGRAEEMKKKLPLVVDKAAAEIINKIDYDFSTIAKNIHPVTRHEWIARSIHIDTVILEFIKQHPKAAIVNIGCGLDTKFDRIDNGQIWWYDLDFPDVIELRKKLIPETERRKCIAKSFLDDSWFKDIVVNDGVLFMAAGVMYYFEEKDVKEILGKMAEAFPGGEFVADVASPIGIRAANKQVIEGSGLDERSYLKWGIMNSSEITQWNSKIQVVGEWLMYKGMKKGLSLKHKLFARMSDKYKIMYMVHLRFLGSL
jgi:O-methyltransferase involved in polyketide biosynthesis